MKKLNFLSNLLGLGRASQSSDVGYDCRLTVVRPSIDCRSSLLKLVSVLVLILTIGSGNAWGTDYQLVTSTSDLEAGAKYLIGTGTSETVYFVSTASKGNNRDLTSGTVTSSKVTKTDAMMALTLGGSSGAWTFYTNGYLGSNGTSTGDGYLNATSTTGSNYLKVVLAIDAYAYFSIGIASNVATITCTGKASRNIVRWNHENSNNIISCYSSGYSDVYLYKEVSSCSEITPSLTYSAMTLTVCGSNATVTNISGNTCSATPSYAVTAASPAGCITVNASTGEVTPVAAGSATVTATFPKTSTCCAATATKNFTVSAASARTVSWYVEGSVSNTTSVVPGNQATPPTPDPTSSCGGDFVGWVAAGDDVVGDKPSDNNITPPSTIYTSSNKPTITCDGNVEFHAVFRKN